VVTGATGNVGTSVVERLERDPEVSEIIGVARREPTSISPKLRFTRADVARDDLVAEFRGADAVVHLAWQFHPTHRPVETWEANAVGSARVFAAAARAEVPTLVSASSVGAYSPNPGARVDESWPTNSLPTAGYGREKAYVERLLDAFEGSHPEIRVVRLRPAFIFQPRAAAEQRRIFAGPFVPSWIGRRGLLPVVPVPKGLRFQAVTAADVAEAYRLAVVRREARGAFNVAADPVIDADRLAEILGTRAVTVPASMARAALAVLWHLHVVPAEPALLDLVLAVPELDVTRAREELGWTPTTSSVDALRAMLDGLRDNEGGGSPPLAPDSVPGRLDELRTGVGERNLA
jgi:nucleoside-diphosphate-sugar epimerase